MVAGGADAGLLGGGSSGAGARERAGLAWPWLVFGSNAIVAYMFSELLPSALGTLNLHGAGCHRRMVLYLHNVFTHIPNPDWAAFAYSVSFTAVCFIPVWMLYRKKIFIKV